MSTWRICEKWDLEVELKQAAVTKKLRAFHEFPAETMGRRTVCREQLVASLPPVETVRELFGGLGLTATMIRNLHHPKEHRVTEIHPDLVEHLRRNRFDTGQEHAFAAVRRIREHPYDLVDADFGLFTVLQWERKPELQQFMEDLFNGGHRHIFITDEAVSRLGVNRDKYARVLDAIVNDLEDYVNGWSRCFYGRYGYSIVQAEHHRGATYTRWGPVPPSHVKPNKTTAAYEGVRVL